ncbi:MAG: glycosyltransferase, partial [Flavobacteriales bacterium]|nr:glycosyltransferase [Flavobacteriales bacterium]
MNPLRATVVTPSFQQAAYLEECLRSVKEQDAPVEHIVVDGGSTDGSREVIERHAGRLAWWCSEKDQGQSDAINKGLAHASGDVFTWVNSDDALTPAAVQEVLKAFSEDPQLQVFGGQVVHRDANGDRVFERLNDATDQRML